MWVCMFMKFSELYAFFHPMFQTFCLRSIRKMRGRSSRNNKSDRKIFHAAPETWSEDVYDGLRVKVFVFVTKTGEKRDCGLRACHEQYQSDVFAARVFEIRTIDWVSRRRRGGCLRAEMGSVLKWELSQSLGSTWDDKKISITLTVRDYFLFLSLF